MISSIFTSVLDNIVCWIETALVDVLNAVIVALGATAGALFALLPNMPTLPALPSTITNAFGYVEYFFPIDWFMGEIATFLLLAFTWWGLAIAFRWVKGVRADA